MKRFRCHTCGVVPPTEVVAETVTWEHRPVEGVYEGKVVTGFVTWRHSAKPTYTHSKTPKTAGPCHDTVVVEDSE